jgi:hypothetical protein
MVNIRQPAETEDDHMSIGMVCAVRDGTSG